MRQSCYGHSPQQLSLPQQRVIPDVTNSVGRLEVLCHAGSTCTVFSRVKACLPGSQSQNSNRLMLPAQLSLGVKACFTGNQSEDSNRLTLPAQLSHGSRLASRATNQKIAIAWCDPLAGKEILCIQLSWIGHPIFKAILLFRCSIFFCWLAGRISCYVKVKPLSICNLAPFFLSCFLDNELT